MPVAHKFVLIAAVVAYVEARFGQEQIPTEAVRSLDGKFGQSGQASTLAGQVPGVLLGAANPCGKLSLADQIVATLGNDQAVIDAAAGLVASEQNFNPFATDIPNICGDASLPATEALRGIVPLVDPEVTNSDVANALSAQSLQTPLDATGLSVADVMIANGFSNLAIDGQANTNAGDAAGAGEVVGADGGASAVATTTIITNSSAVQTFMTVTVTEAAAGCSSTPASTGVVAGAAGGGSVGQLDLGSCSDPSIRFAVGLDGRKEAAFAPNNMADFTHGSAQNIKIISSFICGRLNSQCKAPADTISACNAADAAAQAQSGQAAADAFNAGLGL